MFDASKFTVPKAKPLPVILLLDVSGSMQGGKIKSLNEAVKDMLATFRGTENGETEIHVAIITFGAEVKLHQPLVDVGAIVHRDLSAGGGTPLGTALSMAKAMVEDKDTVPSRAYRPTVILVSDGRPGDEWKKPLAAFVGEGRSSKCDRMAMAIGHDADENVLGEFIKGTDNKLFYAENASHLRDFFKFVTMSVTVRTKSKTQNVIPSMNDVVSAAGVKPVTIDDKTPASSQPPKTNNHPDDDGEFRW